MATPIGRILLMPKGDFNSATVYNTLDWVRFGGASWVCKLDNTVGIAPPTLPTTSNANWQLLAEDGTVGGWTSISGKPFETIGAGLNVNLLNELEVAAKNTYIPAGTSSDRPISGQGVADAIDQTYDGTSAKAQSGVAIEAELDDRLDEYTALASPVSNVVTFSNLNPDYGYEISVDIPDEPSGSLPTTLSNVFVPKCTNIQRSTNADGTINLAYTVTDTNMQYALRVLK